MSSAGGGATDRALLVAGLQRLCRHGAEMVEQTENEMAVIRNALLPPRAGAAAGGPWILDVVAPLFH